MAVYGNGSRCPLASQDLPTLDRSAIEESGTTWYVDGVEVCRTTATSDGVTNIVSNLAVFAEVPPAAGTTEAVKRVDYIRAWERP